MARNVVCCFLFRAASFRKENRILHAPKKKNKEPLYKGVISKAYPFYWDYNIIKAFFPSLSLLQRLLYSSLISFKIIASFSLIIIKCLDAWQGFH